MPVGRKRKFATANSTGHQQEIRGKRSRKTEDSAVTQTSVAVRKGTCRPSKREKKGKKEKAKECIVISSSSEDEESAINKKAVKDSIGTARKPTCRRSKRQKDGVKKGGYAGKSALISTRLNVKRTAAKKAERGGNATTKKATGRRSQRKKKDAKKSSEESRVMPASLNVKRSVYWSWHNLWGTTWGWEPARIEGSRVMGGGRGEVGRWGFEQGGKVDKYGQLCNNA